MFVNNKSISLLSSTSDLLSNDLILISRKNGSKYESRKVEYSVLSSQRKQDITNAEDRLTSLVKSISSSTMSTISSISTELSVNDMYLSSKIDSISLELSTTNSNVTKISNDVIEVSANTKQLSTAVNIIRLNINTILGQMLTAGAYVFPDYDDPFSYYIYENILLKNTNFLNTLPNIITSDGYILICLIVSKGLFSICVNDKEVTRMDPDNDNAVYWIPVKTSDIISISAESNTLLGYTGNFVKFYHTWKPYITIKLLFDCEDYSGYLDDYETTIISSKNDIFVFPDDSDNDDGTPSLYYFPGYNLTGYSCSDGHKYSPGDSLVCISNLTAIGHYKKSFTHYVDFWNESTLISSYALTENGIYINYGIDTQTECENITYPDLRRTEYLIHWFLISDDEKIEIDLLPTIKTISSDWTISANWTKISESTTEVDDEVIVEQKDGTIINIDDLDEDEKPLFIELNIDVEEDLKDDIFILAIDCPTDYFGENILNIK